jgi:hypothetical protein
MAGTVSSREPPGQAKKAAEAGSEVTEAKHPGASHGAAGNGSPGGPPAGVPANGGRGASGKSHKPPSPPGKKP